MDLDGLRDAGVVRIGPAVVVRVRRLREDGRKRSRPPECDAVVPVDREERVDREPAFGLDDRRRVDVAGGDDRKQDEDEGEYLSDFHCLRRV